MWSSWAKDWIATFSWQGAGQATIVMALFQASWAKWCSPSYASMWWCCFRRLIRRLTPLINKSKADCLNWQSKNEWRTSIVIDRRFPPAVKLPWMSPLINTDQPAAEEAGESRGSCMARAKQTGEFKKNMKEIRPGTPHTNTAAHAPTSMFTASCRSVFCFVLFFCVLCLPAACQKCSAAVS